MRLQTIIPALLLALCVQTAGAMMPSDESVMLERALTLLEHRRWNDARHELQLLRERSAFYDEGLKCRIEYGLTCCAVGLKESGAEARMLGYLKSFPESVHANDVHFMLAIYYCEQEDYTSARREFGKVSYKALTLADRERYDLRVGYIEFLAGDFDSAYAHFAKVSPTGVHADYAAYYRAYIHYRRGELDRAYDGFVALERSDAYAPVIPYYLIQIEFSRGNYDYVVRKGDALLAKAADAQKRELLRIVAESWYRLEGYNKSALYISMFGKQGGEMGREENYILGYSLYRCADYAEAAEAFRKVCTGSDELAQNASYHLADCYLRQGDKRMAIYSFSIAADSDCNDRITEDALFNYGKLLFETGGGRFNESINVLTRYVNNYPDAPRVTEARELLVAAYYNSRDYDMAYAAIKSLERPDGTIRTALQKITYFNGLEAFRQGDHAKARASLEESYAIGVSPKYKALSAFWLGETDYAAGRYEAAAERYGYYLKHAPKSADEYRMALYNMGYSRFSLGDMSQAARSFSDFVTLYKSGDSYRADAFNRLGDAYYSQRNFVEAERSYASASAVGTAERCYADYQRALSLGLLGRTAPKIDCLRSIIADGSGDYVDDATYELGRTFVASERYAEGASALEELVEKYPSSPYRTQALLDLGLVHFNLGDMERSFGCYDAVIVAAPRSEAAKEAIQGVREIYVARGDVQGYFDYAGRTGVECDLSLMTRDSLSFSAAQRIYLAGKSDKAIKRMREYLSDYPKGYYTDDALFCLADSYLKCDSLDAAVVTLSRIAELPSSKYTLPVLQKLSQVCFDNRMYDTAANAYRRLYGVVDGAAERADAAAGYVASALALGDDDIAVAVADDADTLADVAPATLRRARFAKANVLRKRGAEAEARAIYLALSGSVADAEGSESAYNIIAGLYAAGETEECERRIYAFADSKPSHAYWLGKAFILLGDIYADRGDAFQARATYQSVADGYTPADDGVVAEAKLKIEKLNDRQ